MAEEPAKNGGERYKVVVPIANPSTEKMLLRIAAACARDHHNPELIVVNVLEVPPQTALSQEIEYEKQRVEQQKKLLDEASDIVENLDVSLRTEAIAARDISDAILEVVERENPNRVMLGWTGERKGRDYIFGTHLDHIIENVSCEISLIKIGSTELGNIVALAGSGPITPLAARQAYEIALSSPESSLTLLNAKTSFEEGALPADTEEEEEIIRRVAEKAQIPEEAYESRVVTGDDLEKTLLEAVADYETICIGATRDGILKQALKGSLPQTIAENAHGNIIMVNEEYSPRTIREAIVETLTRSRSRRKARSNESQKE